MLYINAIEEISNVISCECALSALPQHLKEKWDIALRFSPADIENAESRMRSVAWVEKCERPSLSLPILNVQIRNEFLEKHIYLSSEYISLQTNHLNQGVDADGGFRLQHAAWRAARWEGGACDAFPMQEPEARQLALALLLWPVVMRQGNAREAAQKCVAAFENYEAAIYRKRAEIAQQKNSGIVKKEAIQFALGSALLAQAARRVLVASLHILSIQAIEEWIV